MSFVIRTLAAVVLVGLAIPSAQAAPQAICGAHGRYLNTDGGYTPCDIAAILVGGGGEKILLSSTTWSPLN